MQYVTHAASRARRFAGIAAICALGAGLGACANMQGSDRQGTMPVMPEDRSRSYDNGNVTVYPLQGPVRADSAGLGGDRGNMPESHSSHGNPDVTVYSLDDNAGQSYGATARNAPVEARALSERERQLTGQQSGESRPGFEDAARDSTGGTDTPIPLASRGQQTEQGRQTDQSARNRMDSRDRRDQAQSASSDNDSLTDYGRDSMAYNRGGTNRQDGTGDRRAESRTSAGDDTQDSDNRRLLTGP